MTTPVWQAGKLYLPGDLVRPATALPPTSTALDNPGFEDGDTGWDKGGGWAIENNPAVAFEGGWDAWCTGASGELVNDNAVPVQPGVSISATCKVKALGTVGNGAGICIAWYDASDLRISRSDGNGSAHTSGFWENSSVTAQAPEGAVSARLVINGNIAGPGFCSVDSVSWNYSGSQAPTGLIFKAVQPAAGTSAAVEPVWPDTVGVTVVDNEVIWEAVQDSRVVWKAFPILKSGAVEPVWPEDVGATVADNTIAWVAVSRRVEDPNLPNSDIVAIAASKVHVGDDDISKYSATVNPLDWTTADDAGYIPTGLQQYGANPVSAIGLYRGNLVIFNSEAFQMWQIDEDPADMALLDALPIGSTRHFALCPVSNDLFFLSSQGVRTVGIAGGSTNLEAGDVGMPIDVLVQQAVAAADALGVDVLSLYYPAAGQYWLILPGIDDKFEPDADSTLVFVYSMTRVGSVGAWSIYVFPYKIADWAIKGDNLYLRSGDKVFRLDETLLGDRLAIGADPVPFMGIIEWNYLDFGAPGVTKPMQGFDIVGEGSASVQFGYDQTNPAFFTAPFQVPADTVPGFMIPMPIAAPSYKVRLTYDGTEAWHFQAMNLYLDDFRVTS